MRAVKIIGFLILLLGLAIGYYFINGNYSEGYRTGTIMKVSKKGILFKTHEGQLNVGGFDNTANNEMSNVWAFSITDKGIMYQIEDAVDKAQRVKLQYKEKFITIPWRGKTKYIVYKVEVVN
ncbi:MAG: hypothetical protein AB8B61_07585 [Cyclobacteriaceae bacterium]